MEDLSKVEIILWDEFRSGDLEALGSLYDLFVDNLFTYGMQLCSDKPYVMDCIHDLFLDLYKYRTNLSSTDNVKYYLLRSLKNKILKKQKGKLIYLSDLNSSHKKNDSQNYFESHEVNLINRELLYEKELKVSNAIAFLSKKQKQGLFLRFTEEKEYKDIAIIMNVSVQTSRTIIYRAIKVLREQLTIFLILYQITFF